MQIRCVLFCFVWAVSAAFGNDDPPGEVAKTPAAPLANAQFVERFQDQLERLSPTLADSPADAGARLREAANDVIETELGKEFLAGVNVEVLTTEADAAKVEADQEKTRIHVPAKWLADTKRHKDLFRELLLGYHTAKAASALPQPPSEAQAKSAEREQQEIRKAFAAHVSLPSETPAGTNGNNQLEISKLPEPVVPVRPLVITEKGVEFLEPGAAPKKDPPPAKLEPLPDPLAGRGESRVRAALFAAAMLLVLIAASQIGRGLGTLHSRPLAASLMIVLSAAVGAGVGYALPPAAEHFAGVSLNENPGALVLYGILLGLFAGLVGFRTSRRPESSQENAAG